MYGNIENKKIKNHHGDLKAHDLSLTIQQFGTGRAEQLLCWSHLGPLCGCSSLGPAGTVEPGGHHHLRAAWPERSAGTQDSPTSSCQARFQQGWLQRMSALSSFCVTFTHVPQAKATSQAESQCQGGR